ncbi:hypothetical protein AKJ49_02260 [candidate division MSBL1 archaeon SCGC-AAA382A03]|uniref:HTH marR-type domain-containing protein n=1 Tax=candidate division MSBL1 archaeon SCGC-AAA382A03 TaxID=1698278 RepID=A0A133VCW7_9EURY|nr:hypothetical protein AKJ49_02260 [candidate division MSBL1 archaeon SCGC-AAA382A03]
MVTINESNRDLRYSVKDVENIRGENSYKLNLTSLENKFIHITENGEKSSGLGTENRETTLPASAYEMAIQTESPVLVVRETKGEKNTLFGSWPFSISIGIAASSILAGLMLSKQELRGNATSKLLEEGLETLTVRDVEIFSEIMKLEEFTIPQIMKRTDTSKVTTWRTVKKLVEEGLVEKTNKKRAPSRGLGGRGKPSQVYRFLGDED